MITIRARQRLVVGSVIAGVVAAGCGHARVADASPPPGDERQTVSLTGVVEAAGDLARKDFRQAAGRRARGRRTRGQLAIERARLSR